MHGLQRWGSTPSAGRARSGLLIIVLALASLVIGLVQARSEAAGASPHPKVTICHATGSAGNPYVEITVSHNAANGEKLSDHTSHDDDIIPAPAAGCPSSVPPGPGEPGGSEKKVDVCHRTSSETNPVVKINISQSALQTHLDHGDSVADPVTGCAAGPNTPGGNPGGNPGQAAATVVVGPAPVQAAAPSQRAAARVCTSRRSFRIRIRSRRRDPVVNATVSVNGKRVKTLRGKRVTAPVVLRGLPKGRFLVKITATTRKGRKITGTRRYLTCTPKSKIQTIPLL